MKRMTMEQKNLLNKRIGDLYGWVAKENAADRAMLKDTPEVKKARAIVDRFDKANNARRKVVEEKFAAANREAREALAFKEPQEAYAFVLKLKPILEGKK